MKMVLEKIKNNKFLTLVFLTYVFLFIFIPEKGIKSFNNSLYYVKEMLIIMPVILLLVSLIEAWVPRKTIENALGKKSGIKGITSSYLLDSFSAGPIYAAFPVCKALIKKGASVKNIVVILSSWAVIKVPMLANEAKFLGPKFMGIRWILTIISIIVMALLTSVFVKKEEIPIEESIYEGDASVVSIDEQLCIGCGLCAKISPDNFVIENKKARITKEIRIDEKQESVAIAIEKCPVKAIRG